VDGVQYRNRRTLRALLAAPFRRTARRHKDKAERSTPKFSKFTDRELADAAFRIHKAIVSVIRKATPAAMAEAKKAFPAQLASETVEMADPNKVLADALKTWVTSNFHTGQAAAKPEIAEMGITIDWDAVAKDGIEFLANYCLKLAEKLTADAEFELRYTIMNGLMSGKGAQGIAKQIRDMGDEYYDRAEIIARTEGMRAMNQGRLGAYHEAGVEEVAWIASDLACPECRPMDGQIFKLGEQPEIPLHPQCRCCIGAVTEFTDRTGDRVNWGD
jgi:SPP1 gp7 family putative phage head morphogenesis protein